MKYLKLIAMLALGFKLQTANKKIELIQKEKEALAEKVINALSKNDIDLAVIDES